MAKRYWLFKSDPETFGLAHLRRSPNRTTGWDGVRNYQARNLLRDEVRVGDGVLFYHSRQKPPAVVATAEVVRAAYPDPEQYKKKSPYFDEKSTRAEPRWVAVDIRLAREFERPVGLPELREQRALSGMVLLNRSRLSIQPVSKREWVIVTKLGGVS